MVLDFHNISNTERYKVMSQTVIPRPIAWIVTEDAGVLNIAPFSYFTPLSSDPAIVVVSIGHKKDGTQKDTLANIVTAKKCTICFVKEELKDLMDSTKESLPKKRSEADEFDITTEKILEEYPPIIQGVDAAFFCDYFKTVDIEGKTIPILLEIKNAYYQDANIDEDLTIDLKNIARVGKSYGKIKGI